MHGGPAADDVSTVSVREAHHGRAKKFEVEVSASDWREL
jgi:hypothetical protein